MNSKNIAGLTIGIMFFIVVGYGLYKFYETTKPKYYKPNYKNIPNYYKGDIRNTPKYYKGELKKLPNYYKGKLSDSPNYYRPKGVKSSGAEKENRDQNKLEALREGW
ncbi:hypothetical protein [Persephonella sp.]